jgi:ribosomal protein S18 acetylase RimI-like enzyme
VDSNPLPLSFRPFASADLALLGPWLAEAGFSVPAMAPARMARRLTEDPAIRCVTACDAAGQPAGFVRLDLSPDRAAELTLIVCPARQRRGIGRALLEHALALARQRGWQRLWALVRSENTPARRLFAAVGFEEEQSPLHGYVHLVRLVHRRPSGAVAPLEIAP